MSGLNKEIDIFLRRQIASIRSKGILELLRKTVRSLSLVGWFLLLLIAIPAVVLIRMFRTLICIRFGSLQCDRLGPFAMNPEIYLCEKDAGMHGQKVLDVFYPILPFCNSQLRKMWKRVIHIHFFAKVLYKANLFLPGGKEHKIPWREAGDRDIFGLLSRTEPHLKFTEKEEVFGKYEAEQLGISLNKPFVCFHVRDSLYLERMFPDHNWSYHGHRDCNINNYIPAIEELARRGYLVVRMGAIVKEALKVSNPKILDYATTGRTDFLDIFLSAKCRFFICDSAGIFAIPTIFRIPVVRLNFVALEFVPTWGLHDLFIPRKLWSIHEKRFLTFSEILDSGIGQSGKDEDFKRYGLELIENTEEEINAVVLEMEERLKGSWQTTDEDEELQKKFWSLYKESQFNKVFISRIGADFLRQNKSLLYQEEKISI